MNTILSGPHSAPGRLLTLARAGLPPGLLACLVVGGCKNTAPAAPPEPPAASHTAADTPPPVDEPPPTAGQPDLLPPATAATPEAPVDTRSPAEIQRVITENRPPIRECYEEALKTNPGIEGDLVVQFVIAPAGKVKSAEVNWQESDIHVPELEECALARLRLLQFPRSSRGLESKVTYPYNFHPGH